MARITGIGGIFLHLDYDAKGLLDWYHTVLNLDVSAYGINFLMPNQFTLITFDNKNVGSINLNFTVDDLECFIMEMRHKDIPIFQEITALAGGKFAQIKDPAGNLIELWEPNEEEYVHMVQQEIAEYESSSQQPPPTP